MSSFLKFKCVVLEYEENCHKCGRKLKQGARNIEISSGRYIRSSFQLYYCFKCYNFPINGIEQNIKKFRRTIKGKDIREKIKKAHTNKYEFLNMS